MHTIHWDIKPLAAPKIYKYCKTCGVKQPFVSSGLFRVNANHHVLDIWLVYRCLACDRTWNMEIHERIHPRKLDPARLRDYQENDPALAMRCAHNRALHTQAGVEADYTNVPLAIEGPDIDWVQLDGPLEIMLQCDQAMNIRVQRILREKLALSGTGLKRMVNAHAITCQGANILKAKLMPGLRILLTPPAF